MRFLVAFSVITIVSSFLLPTSQAATFRDPGEQDVGSFGTLTIENDLFAGKDGGYTNGIGYSWGYGPYDDYADSSAPEWMVSLADLTLIDVDDSRKKAVSYSVFQAMQTPENIKTDVLIENDLPYAGMLGWQGTLYSWDSDIADQFYVITGVVGPASLAEKTQKLVHDITSSDEPRGWDNQLRNELVFSVAGQRSWRFDITPSNGVGADFLTFASGSVGTFTSDVAGSAMIRVGSGLEETFPSVSILPGRDINPLAGAEDDHFYMFLAAQASYVFNDIFVDGNTFQSSHSVTLKHEQFVVSAGAVWNWDQWGLLFSIAEIGSTFEENDVNGRFGSLSFSYRF
ncbi:lipid A deacylase LpxR family protein [Kangiella sediminilitoris]|uniref:Lipid A deacylase LpxR family protein n=1 Tax=Kangiella sediminilitoris TaxID=1144748 RepID=A0A1B3BCV2_9GAMM|nr:lipid A deacylase LpxR family protein [Kangiella sediminilitoris]AOE50639.1 hypothetical protein KS2013_1930 [Kangiella sediminilitoris]